MAVLAMKVLREDIMDFLIDFLHVCIVLEMIRMYSCMIKRGAHKY